MLSTSRRIYLYWLLLLVPALIVGLGAAALLRREQKRIAQQGEQVREARRAASGARARLIVENIELLIGDVQNGLLDALATAPDAALDSFLDQWQKENPLVRVAFVAESNGRLVRPNASIANEESRGFVRRFARLLREQPPWQLATHDALPASPKLQGMGPETDQNARQEISSNVAQVQSARRDVQQLLKTRNSLTPPAAPAESSVSRGQRSADYPSPAPSTVAGRGRLADAKDEKLSEAAAPDRRGWIPIAVDGHMHLLAWVQPTSGSFIRGVEVEMASLVGRLGAALPTDVETDEGYLIRDEQGRVLHQIGAIPRVGAADLRVPLAASLLPGWTVEGYLIATNPSQTANEGIVGIGLLLVAIFVCAIVAGGSLLLWQARRSEAEAAQKTSFVANVSHEFKTPLTTIRLYSELLEQGRVRDGEQTKQYLTTIGRETQRLARLVNNVLDFSRLEQGRKKYARDSIDLTAEVPRLLDIHAPRLAESGMKLEQQLPLAPIRVIADRDALEQILLNVIDNAAKYAAEGHEVCVAVKAIEGAGAEIRIGDRGPGVPPAHRARIFEKFHRVDDSLTAEKSGAGLGLSIARQLAVGMGGDLAYSDRAGGGAEFVLTLPASTKNTP